ncbi:MAG: hypothetical protein HY903_12240 [Deltaproteobacteria bacterium]|nr:hypothetical protein [Deltaproteobacteria bacterium]
MEITVRSTSSVSAPTPRNLCAAPGPSYKSARAEGVLDAAFVRMVDGMAFPAVMSIPSPVDKFFRKQSVKVLKGVGVALEAQLAKKGIKTVADLAWTKVDLRAELPRYGAKLDELSVLLRGSY